MPSCLVRLTLLLLPAALAAGLRALAVKDVTDAIAANQAGGDMGITIHGDLYCYGGEKRSEKGDNGSDDDRKEEYQDETHEGNCNADRLCIENDYGALSEDSEDSIGVTTWHCIGGHQVSACNSMYLACKNPKGCQVVCRETPFDDTYACNSVHVCEGTDVVCKNKEGETVTCENSGIENGTDMLTEKECWKKVCEDEEALVFEKEEN